MRQGVLLWCVGWVGCAAPPPSAIVDHVPRVAVVAAEPAPAMLARRVRGVAEPSRDVLIVPLRPGRVTERSVAPGATVGVGQVLVRLDAREAEARLAAARSNEAMARVAAEEAARSFARVVAVEGAATDAQRDAAEAAAQRAEAAAAGAGAQVRLATLEVEHTRLASPIAGVLSWVDVDVGDTVAAGAPIARVVDGARLRVVVSLLEDEIGPARRPEARFLVRAGAAGVEASLEHLAIAADPRTLGWTAELSLEAGVIAAGAPVDVELSLPRVVEGVLVPAAAVQEGQVWVVEAGKVQPRSVRALGEEGLSVRLAGLEAGERVVVHGFDELSPGVEVIELGAAP